MRMALRNILRNGRRSLATILTIMIGTAALVCFEQFADEALLVFQTKTVRAFGHLSVFRTGYFDFGSGNPGAYGIRRYDDVLRAIAQDPALGPMIAVVAPTVTVSGIAGNFQLDRSKPFVGLGAVPAGLKAMQEWDEYGVGRDWPKSALALDDRNPNLGMTGAGLARILGLCVEAYPASCTKAEGTGADRPAVDAQHRLPAGVADLANAESGGEKASIEPKIELLSATSLGAPNVVNLTVGGIMAQPNKNLDDSYVLMSFQTAQQLLFGRDGRQAVAIVIQLRRTADMKRARARLAAMFREHGWNLEVRDLYELNPFYAQTVGFFDAIFAFLACIVGLIAVFTVANTMNMAVLERTSEIGTARALGAGRGRIRRQFVIEGLLLGTIGTATGLALEWMIALAVNAAHISVTFPGQAAPAELKLMVTWPVVPALAAILLTLIAVSALAALLPAGRAARMPIVEALRHV